MNDSRNNHSRNDHVDQDLMRLLAAAVHPPELSDAELERLLSEAPADSLSEEQVQRILVKAHQQHDDRGTTGSSDAPVTKGPQFTQVNRIRRVSEEPSAWSSTEQLSSLLPAAPQRPVELVPSDPRPSEPRSAPRPRLRSVRATTGTKQAPWGIVLVTSACLLLAMGLLRQRATDETDAGPQLADLGIAAPLDREMAAAALQPAGPLVELTLGQQLQTAPHQRQRVRLADGSLLLVNAATNLKVAGRRHVIVERGEVFTEVAQLLDDSGQPEPFRIETPDRTVTALGTKFSVAADPRQTDVLVTQGKVRVSGLDDLVTAGQLASLTPDDQAISVAPRASEVLDWTRDLFSARLVPESRYAGGALVTVDPDGQETRLSLRRYHIDVHIEDGFARTTIDQTYFNATHSRQEGTFHFPLPQDASLSRLAMYVNGKLMEGGMAERQHARNTFEQIRHTRRDPALLEWVDGSTFKMRVFPLEPRQEKRIVLSYTQKLDSAYGKLQYRFPAGHSLEVAGKWSTAITVRNGADRTWASPSHALNETITDDDLVLTGELEQAVIQQDLVVEVTDDWNGRDSGQAGATTAARRRTEQDDSRLSRFQHDGFDYLMLRYRPDLAGSLTRPRRNWIILFEASGDRDPLLARTQIEVVQGLLDNAEHGDSFAIITAGTNTDRFRNRSLKCTPENIRAAVQYLEDAHLVGAINLERALSDLSRFVHAGGETHLVHIGSGLPVLGERDGQKLASRIPASIKYVGVGVGQRWNRAFMEQAAERTGGFVTQINPDEKVGWRAFELLSSLNAPRLLNLEVKASDDRGRFLMLSRSVSHGEEVCAVRRLNQGQPLPEKLIVQGRLEHKNFRRELTIDDVSDDAGYLPRTWARLEINRLLAAGAEKNRQRIIDLSKSTYVMSPFTSLLVLETDEMYAQFQVDRGRKDHWAMYDCPETIPVVTENDVKLAVATPDTQAAVDPLQQLMNSLRTRRPATIPITHPARYDHLNYQLPLGHFYSWRHYGLQLSDSSLDGISSNRVWLDINSNGFVPQFIDFGDNLELSTFDYTTSPLLSNQPANASGFRLNDLSNRRRYFDAPPNLSFTAPLGWRNANLNWDDGSWNLFDRERPQITRLSTALDDRLTRDFSEGNRLLSRDDEYLVVTAGDGAAWRVDGEQQHWLFTSVSDFGNDFDGLLVSSIPMPPAVVMSDSQSRRFGVGLRRKFSPQSAWPAAGYPIVEFQQSTLESLRRSRGGSINSLEEHILRQSQQPRNFSDPRSIAVRQLVESPHTVTFTEGVELSNDASTRWESKLVPLDRGAQVAPIRIIPLTADESASMVASTLQQLFVTDEQTSQGLITAELLNSVRKVPDLSHRWQAMPPAAGQANAASTRFVRVLGNNTVMQGNPAVYGDLWSRSPGLNTTRADFQGELLNLALSKRQVRRGRIDPQAQRLIQRARRLGWETISIPAVAHERSFEIACNGQGDLRWLRRLPSGLAEERSREAGHETIIYREIGLAGRRELSAFHQFELQTLIPWYVPRAADLRLGADVRFVGDRTIEITPLQPVAEADENETPDGPTSPDESRSRDRHSRAPRIKQRLVFAASGRLLSRQLVSDDDDRTLLTQTFAEDGLVRVLDQDGKEVGTLALQRTKLRDAPAELADDGLVILPLPFRSAEIAFERADRKPDATDFASWSEADAITLLVADLIDNNWSRASTIFKERFLDRGDQRVGLYVLISSHAPAAFAVEPLKGLPAGDTDLKRFVWEYTHWVTSGDIGTQFTVPGDDFPLLSEIVAARNLMSLWRSGSATQDTTPEKLKTEVARTCRKLQSVQRDELFWPVIAAMRSSLGENQEAAAEIASAIERFQPRSTDQLLARLEHIHSLFQAAQRERARRLFRELINEQLSDDRLPLLPTITRSQFVHDDVGQGEWNELVQQIVDQCLEVAHPGLLLEMGRHLQTLGDSNGARQLLTRAARDVSATNSPAFTIRLVQQLKVLKDYELAASLTAQLLEDPRFADSSDLWRFAAEIEQQRGHASNAVEKLERAMQLDYESRPEVINLDAVAADYTELLQWYQQIVSASRLVDLPFPEDLRDRVIARADQWRMLDDDDQQACFLAARILREMGEPELAWAYQTTPVAVHANASASWLALARELVELEEIEHADQAFARAFEHEQTNPEILLEHARMLLDHQQRLRAHKLLTQITRGDWQPRFAQIKAQASAMLPPMNN